MEDGLCSSTHSAARNYLGVKGQRRTLASLFLVKASACLFRRRLGGPQSRSEHFEEENKSCPCWESKQDFLIV